MILAGGTGKELSVLTFDRAKTAIPFGGSYRIIDFPLSNCVHSGIDTIAILAQYSPRSLIDHIGMGKPWDLNRKSGGVYILQPTYYGQVAKWYRGTADAIYQNLDMIMNSNAELVLILSGDHVYKMDYREMAARHVQSGKPVTIALKEMKKGQRGRFGMAKCGADGTVLAFEEKPTSPRYNLASMGIYMFDREFLIRILDQSKVDMVFDIIIPLISRRRVGAYIFRGYWEDIGSISSYYNASRKLLRSSSMLLSKRWPIYTRGLDLSPAKFFPGSNVKESIVASGCLVEGNVERSILFPGVVVKAGAEVRDSIVFSYSVISRDAVVERSICDKFVNVGAGAKVGVGKLERSERDPHMDRGIIQKGGNDITVVGKRVRVRRGACIPRGVIVNPDSRIG